MNKTKEFYQGVKAFASRKADDLGNWTRVQDVNPYPEDSRENFDFQSGWEAASDLNGLEEFTDPSQLTLEECRDIYERTR